MTSHVYCHVTATLTASFTLSTLVPPTMNIHMKIQGILTWITFLTLSTWIHVISLYCTVHSTVTIQISSNCKLRCAQVINCKGYVVSRQDTNRNNTKCMLSVRRHYNTTPVTPCSTEHFLKCFLTVTLRVNCLSHKPQENCLYSKCTGWCCLNSSAVQKRFGHSLQTYGFIASCRWTCCFRSPMWLNFFWQMSHVNQVPSLCDFSRCVLSWLRHVKQSEQCLHEYGFAPVWILWRSPRVPRCLMPRLAVEMRTFQGPVEVGFPAHKMEKRVRRNVVSSQRCACPWF